MPRPQPRVIHSQHDVMAGAMAYVDRNVEELVRHGAHVARDGFPASSGGGNGGGTEISRPTENTAVAPPAHDPTGDDIREILRKAARFQHYA